MPLATQYGLECSESPLMLKYHSNEHIELFLGTIQVGEKKAVVGCLDYLEMVAKH